MQNVNAWLASLGLSLYAKSFAEQDIDAEVLRDLTDVDLQKIGVSLGHRKRILRAIAELDEGTMTGLRSPAKRGNRDEGERRQVTVLFCDLVGSTALSALLDPEDLREVIRRYHAACIGVVAIYGGLITAFLGDGVLVCFGYPSAHEDDAERAVRAGLDIIAKLGQIKIRPDEKLRARIGIATGLVVIGHFIGTGPSLEQAIVGETPNLAARLQTFADPGTVVIAPSTRRLVGNLFKLRELGRQDLKGFAEKVEVWAVEGLSPPESRFKAARVGDLTSFLDREEQVGLLLDRMNLASQGNGQIVLISGEAGIGKSRLAIRLCECASLEPHIQLRHQCSPYHTNSALHPFIVELEYAAGFKPEDPPDQRLDKLESVISTTRPGSTILPLLAALLSIPFTNRYPPLSFSATQQRRQTIAALLDRLEDLAQKQLVLFIFEDVHWADATSLEVLDRVVERIRRLPVLILITFRPEYEPPWVGLPNVTTLLLGRLDGVHVEKMVRELTNGRVLPAEVMDQIIAKTDGIPLFVEELTKAVLEIGILAEEHDGCRPDAPQFAIPTTLRDSLMARLDCLAPAKEVAQVGAAIGREFTYALLAAVTGQPETTLKPALTRLEDAKLLFRSGEPPYAVYSFKHALVRDAAYESLLKSRRQVLHTRIAETLCDRFPSAVESEPEVVAHHFTQGGLPEPAVQWWRRAAEKAQGRAAYVEAVAHLTRALGLVDRMTDGPVRRLLHLRVLTAYGNALMASKGFVAPESVAAFTRARKLALQVDDAIERYPIYYGSWATSFVRGHLAQMKEEAETFRRDVESRRRPLPLEAAMAYRLCGATCWFEGDYVGARAHLLRALILFDPARNGDELLRFGVDIGVTILVFLALVLWPLGEVEEAQRFATEAVARALKSGDAHTINYMHFHKFLFDMVRRDFAGAMHHARAYYNRVRDQGLQQGLAWGTFVNGWAAWRSGDREFAGAAVHQGLTLIGEGGLAVYFPILAVLQAEMEAESDVSAAIAEVDRLLADTERTGQHWYDAEIHRQRGELLLLHATADNTPAEAALTRARDVAYRQQTATFNLRATVSLAEVYNATGRRQASRDLLTSALAPFGSSVEFPEVVAANRLISLLT
jgi:class 3 adenylate cyclase/tetratricopeptide (TPR) repeat protein